MEDRKREENTVACPNCGYDVRIEDETQYCPKCGAKLDSDQLAESGSEQNEEQGSSIEINDDSAQLSAQMETPEDSESSVSDDVTKGKASLKRSLIIVLILCIVVFGILYATKVICFHKWEPATCTTAETCSLCNRTRGDALGHKYGKWETIKEPSWREDGEYERVCTRCGKTETNVTEAYLKTVLVMNKTFTDYAKINLDGYEGFYTDTSNAWIIDCGTNSQDMVELSYIDEDGDLISNGSTTLPSKIVLLQFIPDETWSYDRIENATTAFIAATCNQNYYEIWSQVNDLISKVSGTVYEGEPKKATATICGAKVTMNVGVNGNLATILITIEP